MPQNPLLPPHVHEERRSDAGSRKIIEHLSRLEGRLDVNESLIEELDKDVKKQLKHHVTYKWLLIVALSFAAAVVGGVIQLVNKSQTTVEVHRVQVGAEIQQLRAEQATGARRVEEKVDKIVDVLINDKKPRRR